MNRTETAFRLACDQYADNGVDVAAALRTLAGIPLSIHAWQGDDVVGFENTGHALTGGCQVTGSHPGRARSADELRDDLDQALALIPGKHRVCLQAHQVDLVKPGVDRDAFEFAHFANWTAWCKERGLGLDIAPVFYSHPKLDHGFSLSHPDPAIRAFWIAHGRAVRRIGAEVGRRLGTACMCNFWVPDGYKDVPADRYSPRQRLQAALDECFTERFPAGLIRDAVEPKLFGIGSECYTTGSLEFYLGYAATRRLLLCLDSGHFHPTETISDKLSATLCHLDEVLLHVSRGVRWDSDHVLLLNDDLLAIAQEVVRYDYRQRIHIGLDYFDASINRVAAWVIGARNMLKALLIALLEPRQKLLEAERHWDGAGRLALHEGAKSLPWGAVWAHYCQTCDLPDDLAFMATINHYEQKVLRER
jgi:L-rhamnose isomerase